MARGPDGDPAGAQRAAHIIAFPQPVSAGRSGLQMPPSQVGFERQELMRILDLYGRMVAAGEWKDYAMDFSRDAASFCAFRRTADRPSARVEKRPALRSKQGMWALYGEAGQVLKRGHELAGVLSPLERKLLKLVED